MSRPVLCWNNINNQNFIKSSKPDLAEPPIAITRYHKTSSIEMSTFFFVFGLISVFQF